MSNSDLRPDRDVRALFAITGVAGAVFLPFFALVLRDRGFAAAEIGAILATSSLAGVVATPAWSTVADAHLGSVRTLRVALIATASSAVVLVFTGSVLVSTLLVAGALAQPPPPR